MKPTVPFKFTARDVIVLALLASVVAAATGSASAFFLWALDAVTRIRWAHSWLLGTLPLMGVLLVLGYQRWGGGTERGSHWVVEELQGVSEPVPVRLAPFVLAATLLTHLSGGSAGREGTAVQMGAGIAAAVAQLGSAISLHVRRGLLLAGVAAGFGSVFGTPWAGAVFALEFQWFDSLRDFSRWRRIGDPRVVKEVWTLCWLPLVIAAGWLGHAVCLAWGIQHTTYPVPEIPAWSRALATAVAAGLASGLAARGYVILGELLAWGAQKWVRVSWMRPLIGGASILGLSFLLGTDAYLGLGVTHPQVGVPSLVAAFLPEGVTSWSWFWKLILTVLTLGTGFKGGDVTPLLFVGAALGHAVAVALGLPLGLAVAVGMVTVFGAASRTPIACAIMGMELFGTGPSVFLFIGCVLAFAVVGPRGIFPRR